MPLTGIPVPCPACGGLRDGTEDGPPWPFHAKGRHPCECGDDPDDLIDLSTGTAGQGPEESPPGSVRETSG